MQQSSKCGPHPLSVTLAEALQVPEMRIQSFRIQILIGLQFVAIFVAIVSINLSEIDLLRPRRSVRVVCRKLDDALAKVLAA